VRDSLGDLAEMNVLTITKIDEETHQAEKLTNIKLWKQLLRALLNITYTRFINNFSRVGLCHLENADINAITYWNYTKRCG
jgi:hypothetical protein